MAHVVTSACIDEVTFEPECERVCPAGAVRRAEFLRVIDPRLCTDCGDCAPLCPVGAIYPEEAVPGPEQPYIAFNRQRSEAMEKG